MSYSLILKLETIDRDLDWVFKKLDLKHYQQDFNKIMKAKIMKAKMNNNSKNATSEDLSIKYFSQSTRTNIKRLYEKYQVDFEMFGYEGQVQKYIDMGYE